MRVVLFSAHYSGAINALNISRLVAAFPGYEYTYVLIDNRFSYRKNQLKNLLKETVLFFLLRDVSWYRARRRAERKIRNQVPANFDAEIRRVYVKTVNEAETEKVIRELKPDILLQCGAGILKENIFSIPVLGTLNVHHGIAPELRGVSSVFWAMYHGFHEYIGTTVHFVDKTLDTGAVILQQRTELPEQFDYVEAVFQTAVQGAALLPRAIRTIQQEYTILETEVRSYYFSSVNYRRYQELRKNNFKPITDLKDLKYKMKVKKMLVLKEVPQTHPIP